MFVLSLWKSISLSILGACVHTVYSSVLISNGSINGIVDKNNGVEKLLGIPFAEPPVGDRRLRHAVPLEKAFATLEADAFGPSCISTQDQGPESEDCLTLNVWRPVDAIRSNVSLPVLVWFYGGSLTAGYTVSSPVRQGKIRFSLTTSCIRTGRSKI